MTLREVAQEVADELTRSIDLWNRSDNQLTRDQLPRKYAPHLVELGNKLKRALKEEDEARQEKP